MYRFKRTGSVFSDTRYRLRKSPHLRFTKPLYHNFLQLGVVADFFDRPQHSANKKPHDSSFQKYPEGIEVEPYEHCYGYYGVAEADQGIDSRMPNATATTGQALLSRFTHHRHEMDRQHALLDQPVPRPPDHRQLLAVPTPHRNHHPPVRRQLVY